LKEDAVTTTDARYRLIDVNGVELAVRDEGSGIPFVLVQPGLMSSAAYDSLIPRLTDRYRVIAFDSRGHGNSTNPSGELTYELVADDTAALIRSLDLDQPFVGGWSDGGEVGLQVGLRHPGLARGIVAGGTSPETGGSEKARASYRKFFHTDDNDEPDLDAFAAEWRDSFLPELQAAHRHGDAQWQDVIRWSAKMWITYKGISQEEARRITTPTLVVLGDRDWAYPIEDGLVLLRWLPNAEFAILPGSDHMRPVYEPTMLAHILIDFFQRH
jgi:pimeloyl-ACP methyl ester carboxylesterase